MKRILLVDNERNAPDGTRRMLRLCRDMWEMEFVESGEAALQDAIWQPVVRRAIATVGGLPTPQRDNSASTHLASITRAGYRAGAA
jgi:hypothetical protein